jgi:hypothetical protein
MTSGERGGARKEEGEREEEEGGKGGRYRREEKEGGRGRRKRKEEQGGAYHAAAPAVPCTVAKIGTFDNEFQGKVSILLSRKPLVHSLIFIALVEG